jgi:pyrroline-5-carboxylate reductase
MACLPQVSRPGRNPGKREVIVVAAAESENRRIAILGAGNIGQALALGWVAAGYREPPSITLTRRQPDELESLAARGFRVTTDNVAAVRAADVIVVAVQPQQLSGLLEEIRPALHADRHLLVSVVSGASIAEIRAVIGVAVPVVRAMPNTGIAIRESMTCLAAEPASQHGLTAALSMFEAVGRTLVIREDLMASATALCACGIAFFLRAIRAASQGGIEIGFHPAEAFLLASQTAKGAASLLLNGTAHPEAEIDRVTTPRGCTIAGLNEMEHRGFSSAFIKAILASAEKADRLYVASPNQQR